MKGIRYFVCAAISVALHGVAFSAVPLQATMNLSITPVQDSVRIQLISRPTVIKPEAVENTDHQTPEKITKKITEETIKTTPKDKPTPKKAMPKKETPKKVIPKEITRSPSKTKPKKKPTENKKINPEKKTKQAQERSDPILTKARESAPRQIEKPLFNVQPTAPTYPRLARRKGMEGTVLIEVWLDDKGKQTKQILLKSAGFTLLDNAAMKAIKKWQFSAYEENNVQIAHRVRIPVRFNLD